MNEIESIVNRDLLFDFYGDLLTEHQKRIFEAVVFDDRSVSEVAREEGISRQGISDLIRRAQEQMASYEEKLGLVRKFRQRRKEYREIRNLAKQLLEDGDRGHAERIAQIADRLLQDEQ